MEAGRELDWLVAEKVMGWQREYQGEAPDYSTNIADAWKVVERMTDHSRLDWCTFDMRRITSWDDPTWGYDVLFGERGNATHQRNRRMWAPTAPLSICLAALKAIGEM